VTLKSAVSRSQPPVLYGAILYPLSASTLNVNQVILRCILYKEVRWADGQCPYIRLLSVAVVSHVTLYLSCCYSAVAISGAWSCRWSALLSFSVAVLTVVCRHSSVVTWVVTWLCRLAGGLSMPHTSILVCRRRRRRRSWVVIHSPPLYCVYFNHDSSMKPHNNRPLAHNLFIISVKIVLTYHRSWPFELPWPITHVSSNQCHYSYFPGFLQKTIKDISFH